MVTVFSETSTNRLNSGNLQTLIALQNGLRWLLLHSRFSKVSSGGPAKPPTRKQGKLASHQLIRSLLPPRLEKEMMQNSFIFLRSARDCHFKVSWFVIHDFIYLSRAMRKCVLCHMRTIKAQISLRIRAVWSAPLLFLLRKYNISRFYSRNFKTLISFCGCAGRFVSGLVGNSRRHVFSCRDSFVTCDLWPESPPAHPNLFCLIVLLIIKSNLPAFCLFYLFY